MDKFSVNNVTKIKSLDNELEFEKASSLFLQLRVLEKQDKSYTKIRNHLSKLIEEYEHNNWSNEDSVTEDQIKESDLAEKLVQAENEFYQRRKELIKGKLKQYGLNQNDLAKILGHRKGYMSELINGLRPFSKDDLVVINRLFKIPLEDLIPTIIKQDKARHIKKALNSISNNKVRLTKKDFDLQMT